MGINFKKVKENSVSSDFQPIPEDRYNLMIEATAVSKTSKDNDMITVTYVITDGKYKNRKLWTNFTITEKSVIYLYSLLRAIGSNLIEEEDADVNDIADSMIGGKCSAFVSIEKVEDKERNTVSNYKSIEGSSDLFS